MHTYIALALRTKPKLRSRNQEVQLIPKTGTTVIVLALKIKMQYISFFYSDIVVKYMPQNLNGDVQGLMQYSREEVWYKLGRSSSQLDVEEVFQPEKDGYVVSSIVNG